MRYELLKLENGLEFSRHYSDIDGYIDYYQGDTVNNPNLEEQPKWRLNGMSLWIRLSGNSEWVRPDRYTFGRYRPLLSTLPAKDVYLLMLK